MTSETLQLLLDSVAESILPPADVSVSQWARSKFRLSSQYSAVTGEFVPHPYQLEPLDVLSPYHPADLVVLMCSAQMMKTLIMLVFLGYIIDIDPGPVLIVQPTGDDAESFSKERITPMLEDVPALAARMVEGGKKKGGDTLLNKRFRGGFVALTGAISPRGLRRRSVRYLLMDEVDGFELSAGKEGDPVSLARMRTITYWNRKIILSSTPTNKGESRIVKAFADTDQRRYYVPCPFCDFEQTLVWANIRWGKIAAEYDEARDVWRVSALDGAPDTERNHEIAPAEAHYMCANEDCRALIAEHHKMDMLTRGKWVAGNPGNKNPGFHINRLYAPDFSWGRVVVEEYLPKGNDPELIRTFVNTILAEAYVQAEETPDVDKVMALSEPYERGVVPRQALVLTAGIDLQRNWLAISIWGWGRNREPWLVDHIVLEGNTAEPEIFDRLTEIVNANYRHESGAEIKIRRVAIDTGDEYYNSEALYGWIRRMGPGLVMAIKGFAHGESPVGMPRVSESTRSGKVYKWGVKVWPLNVSMLKARLYAALMLPRPRDGEACKPGTVHYPLMPREWYEQLLSEEYVLEKKSDGHRVGSWVKRRERNEVLDTTNYAFAAAFNIRVFEWPETRWKTLEDYMGISREDEPAPAVVTESLEDAPTPQQPPAAPKIPSGSPKPRPQRKIIPPRRPF